VLLILTGALAMSDTATGGDKKETKVKITVRSWDAQGKKFLNPKEGVDARRVETKDVLMFFVPVKQAIGTGQPHALSEITDADGTVYTVKNGSSTGQGEYLAVVEQKPADKKP
jgi:hypothetical protein